MASRDILTLKARQYMKTNMIVYCLAVDIEMSRDTTIYIIYDWELLLVDKVYRV